MTSVVLADSQDQCFKDHLEEHHILPLFNSGDKIEDHFPKNQDVIPSFKLIIIQIGSNNCIVKDAAATIVTKMQQLYEDIIRINPKAQVFTTFCVYYNVLVVYVSVLFSETYYYVLLQFY